MPKGPSPLLSPGLAARRRHHRCLARIGAPCAPLTRSFERRFNDPYIVYRNQIKKKNTEGWTGVGALKALGSLHKLMEHRKWVEDLMVRPWPPAACQTTAPPLAGAGTPQFPLAAAPRTTRGRLCS